MQTAVGQDTQAELDTLCDLQLVKCAEQWRYVWSDLLTENTNRAAALRTDCRWLVTHPDGLPVRKQSPIPVLTGPVVD